MAEQDLDRGHAATPFKLQKARERGQVARSPVVTSAAVCLAAMVYLDAQAWGVWQREFATDRRLLADLPRLAAEPGGFEPLVMRLVNDALWLAAPFLALVVLVAIVANVAQTGPVFSAEPLKPDWKRLNPVEGFKRILSLRSLFVLVRSLLTLVLLGGVGAVALASLMPQFLRLSALPAGPLARTLFQDFSSLGLKLAAMLVLVAAVDWLFTRREFARKMRMSRRELKDEVKHREGDPRVRARIRELRREMRRRAGALRRTAEADVLITNPVHVAVALRYVHGEMSSPRLVAKGRGFMAAVMRGIAARHRIPVVPSPSLARALYRDLAVDQHVRPDLYAPVARIIVWVFARRAAAQRQAGARATGGVA